MPNETNPDIAAISRRIHDTLGSPSMMTSLEKQYLFELAREYYSGAGLIIDAGAFLGASTRCFASGVLENRAWQAHPNAPAKPIFTFERGVCDEHMAGRIEEWLDRPAQSGKGFLAITREFIEPFQDLVRTHFGDILSFDPSSLGPCEIVFLDLCKTPTINQFCVESFFSRLIPGRSLVIQQDFVHQWCPWLNVTMGYLGEYFELVAEVTTSWVYRLERAIPADMLRVNPYTDLPVAETLKHFDAATANVADPHIRHVLHLARTVLLVDRVGPDEAEAFLESLTSPTGRNVHAEYASHHEDGIRQHIAWRRANPVEAPAG